MTTKRDMVKEISERLQLPQVDTKNVVQSVFDCIVEILISEGRLELRDFGVFVVKERKERKARNPKTGAVVMVPPRKVVTFKPGKLLQDKVAPPAAPPAVPPAAPPTQQ
jgi:nucleoid DNA-binding protein